MMLSLSTAYRSFDGEVEASSTPTICRLPDSRRHQIWAIAPARPRQIGEASLISAMDPPRTGSASGTETRAARGTHGDHGHGAITEGTLHLKPARDQGRRT